MASKEKEKRDKRGSGREERGKAQFLASFASGCLSGVLSAVILQPTDVLKTKIQVCIVCR